MIVLRLVLTAVIVIASVSGGIALWDAVFSDPWTRDAHVRADIIEVAPQVSGPITAIAVANNSHVEVGDTLFTIERTDYELAIEEAEALLEQAEAQLALKMQTSVRYDALRQRKSVSVSDREVEIADLETRTAGAVVASAKVALSRARINLARTTVRAPVAGWITNLNADTGDFATVGNGVLAIVDEHSFRVDAFFLETKLENIREGDTARIKLMASGESITGRVRGIAMAISYDQDNSPSLLQNPTPSFQWIRLAQRLPVEIAITSAPTRTPLASGLTASVIVEPAETTRRQTFWSRTLGSIR